MDTSSELLIRYMDFISTAPGWPAGTYPQRMQVCMILDRVAGDMMDEATPKRRAEIYDVYRKVMNQVLTASRTDDA